MSFVALQPLISTGLQPGAARKPSRSRFNGLTTVQPALTTGKRLKPFRSIPPYTTRLKPGSNEIGIPFRNRP
jgi:hypothetical protein